MNYCVSCGKNYDQGTEICSECLAPTGAEITSNSVCSSEAISGTHPWRRLFARTIDYVALYLIIGLIIGVFIPSDSAPFVFTGNEFLDGRLINILILALACIIEPIILTSFGITPGKFLFNIEINKNGSELIEYLDALKRTVALTWSGMAFGVPFLSTVAQYMAYRRLTTTGETSWDKSCGFTITHQPIGWGRKIGLITVLLIMAVAIIVIQRSPVGQ